MWVHVVFCLKGFRGAYHGLHHYREVVGLVVKEGDVTAPAL